MKATFLIILGALCYCQSLHAQKEITIDFTARTAPKIPDIKQGEFYYICVTNINPNLYSVIINSKDTLTSSALKMPTFADVSLSSLSDKAKVASPSPEKAPANGVVSGMNKNAKKIEDNNDTLKKLVYKFEGLKFNVYKQRIDQLSVSPSTIRYDGVDGLKKFTDLRAEISTFQLSLSKDNNTFRKFVEDPETKKFLEKNPEYKDKIEAIGKSFDELKSKSQELLEAISADNVNKLILSVLYLDGQAKTFTSLPMQFTKERTTVDVTFKPRDSTIGVQEEHMSFTFPLYSKEYWSIGTSFYYSNMKQERYSVKTTTIDSVATYQVIEQEKLDRELGIAVLLRGGRKIYHDYIGIHLNIGPGLSINEDPQPRLLFGAGLALGRKHSLTLDLGGIAGFVDRKAKGVDFSSNLVDKQDKLTVEKLKVATFFAVGYTFKL